MSKNIGGLLSKLRCSKMRKTLKQIPRLLIREHRKTSIYQPFQGILQACILELCDPLPAQVKYIKLYFINAKNKIKKFT
jgi:hypothetical protein